MSHFTTYRGWHYGLALAITIAGVVVSAAPAAVLVRDGQPRATIILEQSVSSHTRTAVMDMVDYIRQASGAELPVVDSGDPVQSSVRIFVGRQHPGLAERFADHDLDLDAYEEILLTSKGDDVLIVGRDGHVDGPVLQRGTSQAIYTFIEQQLGVRWLWPGELGTDVPDTPTIEIADFTYHFEPPLKQRYLRLIPYGHENKGYRGQRTDVSKLTQRKDQLAQDWRRRHRGDRRWVTAGHAFTDWFERFGESHPEYFALQPNGKRAPYPTPEFTKLCISDPGVIDQWVDDAAQSLDRHDYQLVVSASPNDSGYAGYCVCDECSAWDPSRGPMVDLRWANKRAEHVALTDRYARWWNILSERITERFPGREIYVGAWAYNAYRTPPVETELRDNIIIGFIGASPDVSKAKLGEDRNIWQGWANQAQNMVWRPNLFYYDLARPSLFMDRSVDQFAWLADNKMMGLDIDALYNHWALQGPQYYLLAKLAWDPFLDQDAVWSDYLRSAFGEAAAPYMDQYFKKLEAAHYALEERYDEVAAHNRIEHLPKIYAPRFLDALQRLLDQATEAATADDDRKRVAFFQVGLDFTRLHMDTINAMTALRTGAGDEKQAMKRAVELSKQRDELLDRALDDFTLNTTWFMTNTTRNVTLRARFGPPQQN